MNSNPSAAIQFDTCRGNRGNRAHMSDSTVARPRDRHVAWRQPDRRNFFDKSVARRHWELVFWLSARTQGRPPYQGESQESG